jgi:hypothetical protein
MNNQIQSIPKKYTWFKELIKIGDSLSVYGKLIKVNQIKCDIKKWIDPESIVTKPLVFNEYSVSEDDIKWYNISVKNIKIFKL